MTDRSLIALQAALREEKMILDAAAEDVSYHRRMIDMRRSDAERCRHHISDLEATIAAMLAAIPVEE